MISNFTAISLVVSGGLLMSSCGEDKKLDPYEKAQQERKVALAACDASADCLAERQAYLSDPDQDGCLGETFPLRGTITDKKNACSIEAVAVCAPKGIAGGGAFSYARDAKGNCWTFSALYSGRWWPDGWTFYANAQAANICELQKPEDYKSPCAASPK